MTATPFLEHWLGIMDSDEPERVLDLITDDFVMSVLFSKGDGQSAEFVGDRAGLVAYLEQREKSVLVHHFSSAAKRRRRRAGPRPHHPRRCLRGVVQRHRPLDRDTGRCRRLLMCRTPEVEFPAD